MSQSWLPDLRMLRYFVAVAEEASVSRAAEKLHIAQPALSRQIQRLEAQVEAELFFRSPKGMVLTEAGEVLLTSSYTLFRQVDQMVGDVHNASTTPQGTVIVGMPPTPGEFIAPALLSHIKKFLPQIELHFIEGFSNDLQRRLLYNEIGIAVMHDPAPSEDIVHTKLLDDRLWLVGAPGSFESRPHTLAEVVAMPLIMPSRPNYIRVLLERNLSPSMPALRIVNRVDGTRHLKAVVRAGHGCTVLTYGAVVTEIQQGSLQAVELIDPVIEWTLVVAMKRDQKRRAAYAAVEKAIMEVVHQTVVEGIWK